MSNGKRLAQAMLALILFTHLDKIMPELLLPLATTVTLSVMLGISIACAAKAIAPRF